MGYGNCSSVLTKTTVSLYQREIDAAKHGRDSTKVTAVETLLKATQNCFGFVNNDGPPVVRVREAVLHSWCRLANGFAREGDYGHLDGRGSGQDHTHERRVIDGRDIIRVHE